MENVLTGRLVENYITRRDNGRSSLWLELEFASEVKILEGMIKGTAEKPQPLIDLLTSLLMSESDGEKFTRTEYLTAVVQALYNIGASSEFVIDTSDWPAMRYRVGRYLQGKLARPLNLTVRGDSNLCATLVKYCNINVYGDVELGASFSEYSNFNFHGKVGNGGDHVLGSALTFHEDVEKCAEYGLESIFTFFAPARIAGWRADNCRFDVMPGAAILDYQATRLKGNLKRELK